MTEQGQSSWVCTVLVYFFSHAYVCVWRWRAPCKSQFSPTSWVPENPGCQSGGKCPWPPSCFPGLFPFSLRRAGPGAIHLLSQSDHNHKSRSEKRMPTRALGSPPPSPSTRSQTGRDWPKAAWYRKPGHRGGIRRLLPVYFFI